MKKILIDNKNYSSKLGELDLHDGEIKDMYCCYDQRKVEIPIILNSPNINRKRSKLEFTGVFKFSISMLEPWGPGFYINEIKITNYEDSNMGALNCLILLNSGDEISVISNKIIHYIG